MSPREKTIAVLKERRITQADLIRLVRERSGEEIPNAKLSEVLAGKQSFTITYALPISVALDISLDWLYDERQKLPARSKNEKGVVLSEAQEEVLKLASGKSKFDAFPEKLQAAIDLLLNGSLPRKAEPGDQMASSSHANYSPPSKRSRAK